MSTQSMAYVAIDPQQPQAAWAALAEGSRSPEEVMKVLDSWERDGAQVKRVPAEQARMMLARWVQPEKFVHPAPLQHDLFAEPNDLMAAAQLLDDCLIRLCPDEFAPEHREAAMRRFRDGGGTAARIASMTAALRQAARG